MNFALIGYGKMGKAIEQVILEQQLGDTVVLKIDASNLHELTVENLRKADIAVEFSTPQTVIDNISLCFEASVPVVVGTTAWLDKLEEVTALCKEKNGGLFYSPNYSIGVNIFFEINRRLAELMNSQMQYTATLEEIHHTEKLDAPSGTAIQTAAIITEQMERYKDWKLKELSDVEPNPHLLITAKREPDVPGTHTVKYTSAVDEIELIHRAKSRRGFAEGAVLAARWMVSKQGIYKMSDLLQI